MAFWWRGSTCRRRSWCAPEGCNTRSQQPEQANRASPPSEKASPVTGSDTAITHRRMKVALAFYAALLASAAARQTILANDKRLVWSGRAEMDGTARLFDWPNSVTLAFQSSSLGLIVNETRPNRYNVYLRGKNVGAEGQWALVSTVSTAPFRAGGTTPTATVYTAAVGLNASEPTVAVVSRISEADYNAINATRAVTQFVGLTLDGQLLDVPSSALPHPARRIEFIGDSLTAGYGAARFGPCRGSMLVEDGDATWASTLCRMFNASCHIEAWSGRGLVFNYITAEPSAHMPEIYRRSFASIPSSRWDFSQWQPSAVVVNLGTNDYCCHRDVPHFTATYVELMDNITRLYGRGWGRTAASSIPIFATVGPVSDRYWNVTAAAVQQARSRGINALLIDQRHILSHASDFGCDGHPSPLGQRAAALASAPALAKELQWTYHEPSPVPPLPASAS